jgi:peptide/nickel transport system ATP-binding protein
VIALALSGGPRLVIADEPTTALDVSIQAQIIELLKRLTREHGTAVMLITHDMGVIAEAADRVAVMYAGRIVEIGPVADVIHRPAHPYTAGLMGSIPSIVEERDRLAQIDGVMPRLDAVPPGCAFHPRCNGRSRAAVTSVPSSSLLGPPAPPAGWRAPEAMAETLLRLKDVERTFDVSPPWLDRVLERKPRSLLKACRRRQLRDRRRRNARTGG